MAIELQQIFDSGEISQPSGGVLPPSLNAGTFFVLNTVSGPVLYVGSAANLPVQVTQTMALENGKLLVGNSLGIATPVNISGDATVANNGLLTISNLAVNTAKIADSSVTYSKIQNVTGNTLLGRSGTTGVVQELGPVAIRSLINVADGANNYVHPNHTGDVTSTGDGATVIANNAVTDAKLRDSVGYSVIGKSGQATGDPQDIVAGADSVLRRSGTGTLTFGTLVTNHYGDNSVTLGKMATLAASTILGRASGAGTGNVTALTAAQVRTILNVADGAQVNTVTSVAGKTGAVTLVSSDVGLENVTNDAQVKKTASATVVGNIPAWASVTGDLLTGGYGVETVLVGDPQALATAEAIKDYVDSLLATNDAMVFKGTLGTGGTVTSLPLTHSAGWTYRVITAGTYAGQVAEVGDLFVAIIDRSGSGNLNSDWTLLQTNIDGAVVGPASSTNDHIALFDGTSGKLLKSAGVVLGNGTLTLGTSGIATGSASFSANQSGNASFTVTVPGTNLAEASRTTTSVQITSSTGTAATLSSATTSLAGLMSSADKAKLDGIAAGAQVGTVTSVSGTGTVSGLTLSGTVTSSGNITLSGTLSVTPSNFSSQTANTFLAAPNGSAGTPTFRAIVAADIPTLNQNTTGTSAGVIKTVTGTNTAELVRGNMADNDQFRILVGGTATNAGYVEIATADDGTEPIHVRQYTGVFTTLVRTATLLDASGNTSFPGTVTAPTFSGALSGNASTATTLQTARTINGVSFNGSANITVTANTTNTIIFNSGGAGESSGVSFDGSVQRTISYNTFGAAAASGVNATGTWPINISGVAASVTDGMYLSTNQNVTGTKTFVNGLTIGASNLAPSLSGITFSYEDVTPGSSTTKLIANDYALGTITVTLPAASGELALVSQIPSVGTGVLTLAVSGVGLSGSATFNANQSTNTTFTVTSNATSSNNANTIVSRDASGNFSAGTITASLTGNASTASTLQTARTLTIGSTGKTFNGSANVSWSLGEIGAAASSHTHSASDITSGDITARIPWANTNQETNGVYLGIGHGSATVVAAGEARTVWEATYTVGNRDAETLWLISDDNVVVRVGLQSGWGSGVTALTIANTGVATFASTVNATTFSGALSGNATTATTLQTARTINGVSFNGSANITITANTTNAITFNDAGSGVGSGTTFDGSVARTISYNTIGAAAANGTNAAGTWGISITGNAATATNTINWKANNSSGILQVTGPGTGTTRVMTAPDSNFTVARTDSSQTFTGTQTFNSTISGSINGNAATVTDGVYLSGTQTITGAKTLEDITIGGSLKTIKYGSVLSITLPAQGTRAAFLNVGVNSVVVVRISSSENAFYQPIELTISRNGTGSTITIHKDNPFFHEHSDDIAFSANTATGDIYAEKILYSTARNFRIHAVETLFGTATVLNGSLTTTGVPDQSITRLGRSIYVSGSAATINGVLTSGVSTGTAPFVVSSTTRVSNLNVATAGTADTLTTARTINGVSFNGSANITITANTPNSLTFNNSGSGASSGSTFNGGSAVTVSYNTIGAPSTTGTNASGTWGISITGNAATVTNGVYTSGDQSIGGLKTFTGSGIDLYNNLRFMVSSVDSAHQRADARDDATNFSRLHWYGVSDAGATSNFRHAWYDGASYINVTAASGVVTYTGQLTATQFNGPLSGNATTASSLENARTIGSIGDVTWSVSFNGSGNVSSTATIANNVVTNAKLRQSPSLSVMGNPTTGSQNVTDITGSLSGQVLRISGSTLGFGALDLASANAVTGILPSANIDSAIARLDSPNFTGNVTIGTGTVSGTERQLNITNSGGNAVGIRFERTVAAQHDYELVNEAGLFSLRHSADTGVFTNVFETDTNRIVTFNQIPVLPASNPTTANQAVRKAYVDLFAPLASPALTGTPTAPTAALNTNTIQIATTAYVLAAIADDAPTKTGSGASGTWAISITGSSASTTGNAATATILQTARSINGTSFNGSADITTANWGTARTITIGGTGKSVNGSANVDWTLSEIGAASTAHKYHSFSSGQYFYDSYEQGNNFRLFTENATFSTSRFRTIAEVEYWDFVSSQWVAWSGGDTNIKTILTGRETGGFGVPHDKRKFRFKVNASTGWPTLMLYFVQSNWSPITYPGMTLTLESSTTQGGTYTLRDTAVFTSANTGSTWGIHAKTTSSLHTGDSWVRVTFDITDWVDSGGSTTFPIKRFEMLSNYAGSDMLPFSWDYDRNMTFNNNVSASRFTSTVATGTAPLTVTSTTRVANLNVATAGTADTLTTARTINGTSFNGSANITTSSWGTSRTITIGSTGKAVNGSGNVSWSLNEIGAAASDGSNASGDWSINIQGNAGTVTNGVYTTSYDYVRAPNGPSGDMNVQTANSYVSALSATANSPFGNTWYNLVNIRHRGGSGDGNVYGGQIAFGMTSYKTRMAFRSQDNGTWDSWREVVTNSGTWAISISGNSATASTLQTARNINGVSFNGSADINVPDLRSSNGATSIASIATTSAVNYLTVTQSTTGNAVGISTAGSDTNIGLTITTKGTGAIVLDTGTGAGQIDLKPGSSNVRVWDDDSSHYFQFVTGNTTANYNITLPAANVTLVSGTMVATSRTLTIANGTGITGGSAAVDLSANRSWTIGLTGQALALHNLGTNGIIARTGSGTVAARTITGTTNQINVSNGDGVSGSPVLSLPQDIHTGAAPTFSTLSLSGGLVTVGQSGTIGSIVIWTEDGVSTPATLTIGVSGSGAAGNHAVNFKRENGTVALLTDIPTVNNGTLTLNVSGTGLSGSTTFSANQSGNATFTVTSNATSSNTASTIVARDGSGNFTAGTITAALSGNASTATTLQTSRNINGVGFNGSANITIPRLRNIDDRTLSPSEASANYATFYFTSWNNNNTSPYADAFILRSYQDASGGSDNLVMFRKDAIGMRIWQQSYGSATAFATYKDVAFTDSNITGSAASLTTTRTIWGQNFNGTADVTGALSSVTTLSMSGQLTNTVATGTAPLVISSTTRVANLNVATAGTADQLTTTRTINGTNFNGTANITTANWGTSRTLTIGNTGKSVNGSANVTWSLAEIGAKTAGDTGNGFVEYNTTTRAAGKFYGGTTDPISTTRLNYDGVINAMGGVFKGLTLRPKFISDLETSYTVTTEDSLIFCNDIAGNGVQITLPASPRDGQMVIVRDVAGMFGTIPSTFLRNGKLINGSAANLSTVGDNSLWILVYSADTGSWHTNTIY